MHTRGARLIVVALLLVVGGAAAFLLWQVEGRITALHGASRATARHIDVATSALAEITLAQHGYVALQDAGATRSLVEERVSQFQAAARQLPAVTRSERSPALLEAVAREMSELTAADARAREYAGSGQTFLASDILSGRARAHLARIGSHLRDIRTVEAAAVDAERAALRDEVLSALAAAAAVWVAGLLLLVFTGGRRRRDAEAAALTPAPAAAEPPRPATPTVDLAAAAALCTDLSRVTSSSTLASLLGRAAAILDARGVIVWLGAGDDLFPAAAHGYDARVLARLAPIGRASVNATATAWRTGRTGTVKADGESPGAIVAPMFGPAHCVGVFAAEVRHGKEQDPATRAVTSLIAAQLAAIVAAWPAPSAAGPDAALDRAAGG